MSRSKVKKLIDAGMVKVNSKPVKASHLISPDERIIVQLLPREKPAFEPEKIPLDIIYEDDYLIVVNKPAGMVVHPGHGNWSGTLMNALLGHNEELLDEGEDFRAGIVHRLDKDTTGLLVTAKDELTLRRLSGQFKAKTVERKYNAIVWGIPKKPQGIIEGNLGRSNRDRKIFTIRPDGKYAMTSYTVLERLDFLSLIELKLSTGRTHQIRVHLSHFGHPVFGDPVYRGRGVNFAGLISYQREICGRCLKIMTRQALHAKTLGFIHPASGEKMSFDSDLPEDMKETLGILREEN